MNSKFGFLLFDQFEDLDFMGPWEILALWSQKFNGPEELILINESRDTVTSAKGLTIHTDTDFSNCPQLDYLLIPGGQGTRHEVRNKNLIAFIKAQKQSCKAILSVCTGAFLLHAAGFLAGRKATTHWASLDRLREFSEVNVIEERFVHDNNIWTSAGISAGLDMALAFIAETAGEKIAGDIQLQAEYYPKQRVYTSNSGFLPTYTINKT